MSDPKPQTSLVLTRSTDGLEAEASLRLPKPPKRRKRKHRHGYFMVIALVRMRRLAKPGQLNHIERQWVSRVFYTGGAMREIQQVCERLSHYGINAGYEEVASVLFSRAWFKPGKILELRQFLLLVKHLKAQFERQKAIPDSHVAFVALGGDEGDISGSDLKDVVQRFELKVDIDAFLEEHDEDGSGRLDYGEFSAMFHEYNEDGTLKEDTQSAMKTSTNIHPVVEVHEDDDGMHFSPSESAPPAAHTAPAKRQNEEREQTPNTVFGNVDAFLEKEEDAVGGTTKDTRRKNNNRKNGNDKAQHREDDPEASVNRSYDESQDPSDMDQSNRTSQQQDTQTSQRAKFRQRPVWERGNEKEAKESLSARRHRAKLETTGFGSARRFGEDAPLEPLPKPEKRVKLPDIHKKPNQSFKRQRWDEVNPFLQSPGDVHRADGKQPNTARLPLIARDRSGHRIIVQQQMVV